MSRFFLEVKASVDLAVILTFDVQAANGSVAIQKVRNYLLDRHPDVIIHYMHCEPFVIEKHLSSDNKKLLA